MERPLKVAAWSGIGIFILSIISGIFGGILEVVGVPMISINLFNTLFSLGSLALVGLFLYGFVILGEKFKSKLLVVMSWIGIVTLGFFVLVVIASSILGLFIPEMSYSPLNSTNITSLNGTGFSAENLDNGMFVPVLGFLFLIWIFTIILLTIYSILFGIGLMKIGDKVELAKAGGIL